MSSIHIDVNLCTGCCACVYACSFHHRKTFGKQTSSIRIIKEIERAKIEARVFELDQEGYIACDLCIGEKDPLCSSFCFEGAISLIGDKI